MVHVLFVCLGNICRSPMAEAVFRHMVNKAQLTDKIMIDSAGTGSWHIGDSPHQGTLTILKENNISAEGLFGRQLKKDDFERFDYIIGMDESNLSNIYTKLNQPKHPKIIRLLDLTELKKDVPDPYYTGNFEETYELITEGCQALLKKILQEQNLI
ncbi:low molecular weight phosphotyrosine protein phosphatase [Bacillus sp. Gen3]|nr:low molecular weight phosphotyrosine protein phosphatase [Bacillus sp. Gen3]